MNQFFHTQHWSPPFREGVQPSLGAPMPVHVLLNREGPLQEPPEGLQLWTQPSVKPCCSVRPSFNFYSGCKVLILGGFVVPLFVLYMSLCSGKHRLPGERWQVLERAFKALLVLRVFALEWVRFSSPCKREVAHSVVNFANNRAKCRGAAAPLGTFVLRADLEKKTMKVSLICLSSLQQSDAFCHLYW